MDVISIYYKKDGEKIICPSQERFLNDVKFIFKAGYEAGLKAKSTGEASFNPELYDREDNDIELIGVILQTDELPPSFDENVKTSAW